MHIHYKKQITKNYEISMSLLAINITKSLGDFFVPIFLCFHLKYHAELCDFVCNRENTVCCFFDNNHYG